MFHSRSRIVYYFILISIFIVENTAKCEVIVSPEITVSEQYDNNANNVSTEGEKKEDFRTSMSAEIRAINERKSLFLSGGYKVSTNFYTRDQNLNYVNHDVDVNFNSISKVAEKTSLSASDTFLYETNTLEISDSLESTERTDIMNNAISLGLNHLVNQKTSIEVGLSERRKYYEDSSYFDNRTDSVTLSSGYQWSNKRQFSASYNYSCYRWDGPVDRDTMKSHSFNLSINEDISPTMSLRISGGISHTEEISSGNEWIASVWLDKNLAASSLKISYSRDVNNSSGLTDEITITERVLMKWQKSLTESFNVALSGSYAENRSEPSSDLDASSYRLRIGCGWSLKSWMKIAFGFNRFEQDSETSAAEDITSTKLFISLTATPAGWRF